MGIRSFFGGGRSGGSNVYSRDGVLLPVANPPQPPPNMSAILVYEIETGKIVDHEWFIWGPRSEEEVVTAEGYLESELKETKYTRTKYRTDSFQFKNCDLFYAAYPQLPRKKDIFW